ncbi:MAG: hypothetical protein V4510_08700 [bacterium]
MCLNTGRVQVQEVWAPAAQQAPAALRQAVPTPPAAPLRPLPAPPQELVLAGKAQGYGITGWALFLVSVAVAFFAPTSNNPLRFVGTIGLGFGIAAWTEGRKALKQIGAANGGLTGYSKADRGRLLGKTLVLIVPIVVVAAVVVFVLATNVAPVDNTPLDYSLLTPPAGARVLHQSRTDQVETGTYAHYDFVLTEAATYTFAYVSGNHDPVDLCLAYPSDAQAFGNHQSVNCFFAESSKVQGRRSVSLPVGSYSVFLAEHDGGSASVTSSSWVR